MKTKASEGRICISIFVYVDLRVRDNKIVLVPLILLP